MAEETPVVALEEQVDLDCDNYNEEMDDDVEEPLIEDRTEGVVHDKAEEEQSLDSKGNGEKQLPDIDGHHHDADESMEDEQKPAASMDMEDEQKPAASMDEDDKEKHAELLSLPPHGSEVFIGGAPKDVTEEDLRVLCESIGEVTEIRLTKDKDTGENKGYAFITFKTKEFAQKAIEEFQSKEFKGRKLRCSLSQVKHKLFMGNIPKSWTEKELRQAIEKSGPGVENIDLVKDPHNPGRNRGFAFIDYYNNACADYARQKMLDPQFKLEGCTPTVSWADSKTTTDASAFTQVKALYVKNIPENVTTEKLKELFERHGEVTKVVLPPAKAGHSKRDFGFIHYADRASALKAAKETETYEIEGNVLDVTLAKPQNEKKFEHGLPYPHRQGALAGRLGYGLVGDPYASLGSGYGAAAGHQPPFIYGRGPVPAGMQMVSVVLPDGQIGYVLQAESRTRARSPPPRRHERRHDRRDSRGYRSPERDDDRRDGSRGRRYRPY